MSNGKMNVVMGGNSTSMYKEESVDESKIAAIKDQELLNKKTSIDAAIEKGLEEAQKVKDKMQTAEIIPNGSNLLVKPYTTNPYQTLEVKQGGLVIPNWDGSFKNPDTGEQDKEQSLIAVATVFEVGPDTKYIKEGDDIYYTKPSAVPVPFFHQGFELVPESRVMVIINEGVKARMEEIKHGR